MTQLRSLLVILPCAFALRATAAPAPWWLWESVTNGSKVCAQTSLGPGWRKLLGPYRDARCEKPFRTR
ncbi:hypothetical protein [Pseudoduganella armeniaca]|uniref:DUF3012 domain-containing protein n=1 Tax=Pseudoduganella armeniaca TaxID=2072590 RepID=A0A2R4C9X1_9BURK|nr:hypothetical protein [Pseudoduganella armeniaca]AVR96395.1 hypothetical protein C9I28_12295 [Pseudoduganella armeniaca]